MTEIHGRGHQLDGDERARTCLLHPLCQLSVDGPEHLVEFSFVQQVVVDDVLSQGRAEPATLGENVFGAPADDGDGGKELTSLLGSKRPRKRVLHDRAQVLAQIKQQRLIS